MHNHKICSLGLLESLHEKVFLANVKARDMQRKLREAVPFTLSDDLEERIDALVFDETRADGPSVEEVRTLVRDAIADAQHAVSYARGLRTAYAEARLWSKADHVKQHDEECGAAAAVNAILERAEGLR